jgi:integrase
MRDVKRRQPQSVYDFGTRLNRFLMYVGDLPLADVTTKQMETWVTRPRGGRALDANGNLTAGKPASQNKDGAVLKSFFGWLHAYGTIARNPAVLLPTADDPERDPTPVNEDVWQALWASNLSDDARIVLGLGFFLGMRRQAIVRLGPIHWTETTCELHKVPYKGNKEVSIPYGAVMGVWAEFRPELVIDPAIFLGPFHAAMRARLGRPRLLDWRERQEPSIAERRKHALNEHDINPNWINQKLKMWLRRAGLDPHAFTPHQLRHGFGTYLGPKSGMPDIMRMKLMGHSDLRMTAKYTRIGKSEVDDWLAARQSERGTTNVSTENIVDMRQYNPNRG